MNKFLTFLAAFLVTASTFAQAPEKLSYQAVIRDAGNTIVSNQAVGMQISVLQTTATGTAVYVETQTPTTNENGLVSIEVGTGSTSDDFSAIDWSAGPYFIKTETDPTGGNSYTITGTSQLLSVPYALHAKTAESVTSTCGLSIGATYQGGIIFYLDATGCHGLIAAPSNQSTGIQWYNGSYSVTNAVRDGIGAGEFNTERIIANQLTGAYAAQICANYQGGTAYGDWYLPSKYELNLMYENIGQGNALGLGNVGNFASSYYWSSTENNNINAWYQNFTNGIQSTQFNKIAPSYVRAVRAF